jgi:hypothetical protein
MKSDQSLSHKKKDDCLPARQVSFINSEIAFRQRRTGPAETELAMTRLRLSDVAGQEVVKKFYYQA